ALAAADGRVRVWDLASLRVTSLPAEGWPVTSLAVSADGDRFATGTEGGTVRVWDSTTMRQTGQTLKLVAAVRCLAFRPDRRALAIGLDDASIPIWEVPRAGPLAPPVFTNGPARALAFDREGKQLVAVSCAGLRRWHVRWHASGMRVRDAANTTEQRPVHFGTTAVS